MTREQAAIKSVEASAISLAASLPAELVKPGGSKLYANMTEAERQERWREERDKQAADELEKHMKRWRAGGPERWAKCGVPARHRQFVAPTEVGPWLEKYQAIKARLCSGFLVALLGDRGTGKTQLAAELLRHDSTERSIRYARAMDFFMAIKSSYRTKHADEDERNVIDTFVEPRLLVLDEAHDRGETEWENRLLNYLIDRRYGNLYDTVLVSNQQPDAFRQSIGESIYSRLVETGGLILCEWATFRK